LFGEAWDDSVYESNIIFASLAYLLNLDDGKLNIIKNKLRKSETYDSLLDFILIGNKSEFDTSKISFPRPYKKLVKSINDEDRDAFQVSLLYRTRNEMGAILGMNLNSQFHISYSYDFNVSGIARYSTGSHELMLVYRMDKYKHRVYRYR
jgi:hypothetical protein